MVLYIMDVIVKGLRGASLWWYIHLCVTVYFYRVNRFGIEAWISLRVVALMPIAFSSTALGIFVSKRLVCSQKQPRTLRVETVEGRCRPVSNVDLKMLRCSREDGEVSLLHDTCVEHIVAADKARVDRSFHNEQCFRRSRMGMWWDDASLGEVEPDMRKT